MNELMTENNIKIEDMIYEIRGKHIMLHSELSVTECHDYDYDKLERRILC